jgi:xylose isomerase
LHGHVGGIDELGRALLAVGARAADGRVDRFVDERYAGWRDRRGQAFFAEGATLAAIADAAIADDVNPQPRSGRQEYLENVVNRYV